MKWRAARCAPVSPTFSINCVVFSKLDNNILLAPISITTAHDDASKFDTQMKALIDSGAEGKFIDQNYTQSIGTNNIQLKELILVLNVDGTWNK